jgi:hypothetical protein
MKLHLVPPFDSPIAPAALPLEEFRGILSGHDIALSSAEEADLALIDGATGPLDRSPLPPDRTYIICGEPPQPEYLLPCYRVRGYAGITTPLNGAYVDPFAYYVPPKEPLDTVLARACVAHCTVQLATYRRPCPAFLPVSLNGEPADVRVLAGLRASVGLELRLLDVPVDIFGQGWPVPVRGCSRHRPDFLSEAEDLVRGYACHLNWENICTRNYVSEKFWLSARAGALPIYYPPPGFSPPGIVDCRLFAMNPGTPSGCTCGQPCFDFRALAQTLGEMSREEYRFRMHEFLRWYYDLHRDSAHQSHVRAAHFLAEALFRAVR